MKINQVTNTFAVTTAHTDQGVFMLGTKRYPLQAGVVVLQVLGSTVRLPPLVIPSIGAVPEYDIPPYPELKIENGTTDPQLLCIARRGWSGRQMENQPELSVPTVEEATVELNSGHDANGEPWPVPRLPAVPLEEALAAAKKEGNV